MKWYLYIWTPIGTYLAYRYLSPHVEPEIFNYEVTRLLVTLICVPGVVILPLMLFWAFRHVFNKLRGVEPGVRQRRNPRDVVVEQARG